MRQAHRSIRTRLSLGGAVCLALCFAVPGASAATATTDSSPVNLSRNVDLAAGTAAASATVVEGDARFEVLAPEVIRMEYSPTGSFLNDPTFDILDRAFTVPTYTTSVSGGRLTVTTSQMTLKYQLGSGPFTPVNTQMTLLGALPPGASANVAPSWNSECTFGQACQSGAYASGPWADHRSAIAFTGDTWGTWNTLANEAQLAQAEGSVGEPYVSDDIGSFLGNESAANVPNDLYLRWLQVGTFQPIMREHSDGVDWGQNARLPWEYDSDTQAVGDQFMQLREQLVPYLYTLSNQATKTGAPMTQALYLDYPSQAAAYTNPSEYLLGPNMLVAPVTTPGVSASTSVWFPPGTWTDYFTGATFTGPSTQTLDVPTTRMPVFVKSGGIVSLQPSSGHAQTAGSAPISLQVYAGGSGTSSMYDDAGTGLGYQSGQSTNTPFTYSENASAKTSTVTIGAAAGSYSGEPTSRTYTVDLVDVSQPTSVAVNGTTLASSAWSYNSSTDTLKVPLAATPVGQSVTITQTGGAAVQRSEPTVTVPSITSLSASSATAGEQITVTGSGFGASQGSNYLWFNDNGTNWGGPGDLATFTINSWSNNSITFTVPEPSGTNGEWAVTPGTTATLSVHAADLASNTENLAIS